MGTTSYLALSRQAALQRHMATIATNLANATTTGYRAEHSCSRRHCSGPARQARSPSFRTSALARDSAPGPIAQTGNPLDLAIDGAGLSRLRDRGRDGLRPGRPPRGRPGWAAGELATGMPLLDDGGNADPPGRGQTAISIAGDGTVPGGNGPIARIGVYRLRQRAGARRAGDGLFTATEPAMPGRAARGSSRVRWKAPTSSRSWR